MNSHSKRVKIPPWPTNNMTSGKNHTKIGLLCLYILFSAWFMYYNLVNTFAFVTGFVFGLIYLSPDLDIKNSDPYKAWGPIRFLWWPFQKLVKHRGISHHIIFGSVVIIAYFLLIFGIVIIELLKLDSLQSISLVWACIGIVAAIELHIIIDRWL